MNHCMLEVLVKKAPTVRFTQDNKTPLAELEVEFAEMDGYSAESRAEELLMSAGIEQELHYGLMSNVAPGWKLRVLLVQALFEQQAISRSA